MISKLRLVPRLFFSGFFAGVFVAFPARFLLVAVFHRRFAGQTPPARFAHACAGGDLA